MVNTGGPQGPGGAQTYNTPPNPQNLTYDQAMDLLEQYEDKKYHNNLVGRAEGTAFLSSKFGLEEQFQIINQLDDFEFKSYQKDDLLELYEKAKNLSKLFLPMQSSRHKLKYESVGQNKKGKILDICDSINEIITNWKAGAISEEYRNELIDLCKTLKEKYNNFNVLQFEAIIENTDNNKQITNELDALYQQINSEVIANNNKTKLGTDLIEYNDLGDSIDDVLDQIEAYLNGSYKKIDLIKQDYKGIKVLIDNPELIEKINNILESYKRYKDHDNALAAKYEELVDSYSKFLPTVNEGINLFLIYEASGIINDTKIIDSLNLLNGLNQKTFGYYKTLPTQGEEGIKDLKDTFEGLKSRILDLQDSKNYNTDLNDLMTEIQAFKDEFEKALALEPIKILEYKYEENEEKVKRAKSHVNDIKVEYPKYITQFTNEFSELDDSVVDLQINIQNPQFDDILNNFIEKADELSLELANAEQEEYIEKLSIILNNSSTRINEKITELTNEAKQEAKSDLRIEESDFNENNNDHLQTLNNKLNQKLENFIQIEGPLVVQNKYFAKAYNLINRITDDAKKEIIKNNLNKDIGRLAPSGLNINLDNYNTEIDQNKDKIEGLLKYIEIFETRQANGKTMIEELEEIVDKQIDAEKQGQVLDITLDSIKANLPKIKDRVLQESLRSGLIQSIKLHLEAGESFDEKTLSVKATQFKESSLLTNTHGSISKIIEGISYNINRIIQDQYIEEQLENMNTEMTRLQRALLDPNLDPIDRSRINTTLEGIREQMHNLPNQVPPYTEPMEAKLTKNITAFTSKAIAADPERGGVIAASIATKVNQLLGLDKMHAYEVKDIIFYGRGIPMLTPDKQLELEHFFREKESELKAELGNVTQEKKKDLGQRIKKHIDYIQTKILPKITVNHILKLRLGQNIIDPKNDEQKIIQDFINHIELNIFTKWKQDFSTNIDLNLFANADDILTLMNDVRNNPLISKLEAAIIGEQLDQEQSLSQDAQNSVNEFNEVLERLSNCGVVNPDDVPARQLEDLEDYLETGSYTPKIDLNNKIQAHQKEIQSKTDRLDNLKIEIKALKDDLDDTVKKLKKSEEKLKQKEKENKLFGFFMTKKRQNDFDNDSDTLLLKPNIVNLETKKRDLINQINQKEKERQNLRSEKRTKEKELINFQKQLQNIEKSRELKQLKDLAGLYRIQKATCEGHDVNISSVTGDVVNFQSLFQAERATAKIGDYGKAVEILNDYQQKIDDISEKIINTNDDARINILFSKRVQLVDSLKAQFELLVNASETKPDHELKGIIRDLRTRKAQKDAEMAEYQEGMAGLFNVSLESFNMKFNVRARLKYGILYLEQQEADELYTALKNVYVGHRTLKYVAELKDLAEETLKARIEVSENQSAWKPVSKSVGVFTTLGIGGIAMLGSNLFKRLFEKGKKYTEKDKRRLKEEFADLRTNIIQTDERRIAPKMENLHNIESFGLLQNMILKIISEKGNFNEDNDFQRLYHDIFSELVSVDNTVRKRIAAEPLKEDSQLAKALKDGLRVGLEEAENQFEIRKNEKISRDKAARTAGAILGAALSGAAYATGWLYLK